MEVSQRNDTRFLRIAALCGIAGPIVFAVLVTIGGSIYEGYSHATQAISELAGADAEYPVLQTVNFFIIGIVILVLAVGLHRGIGGGRGSAAGPLLVGIFGVSAGIGNGIFPCDSGCDGKTTVGLMHNLTGMVGFVAATASVFIIRRRLKAEPYWQPVFHAARIFSFAMLVTFVMWIGIAKIAEVDSVNEALQRLYVGTWLVWIEIMAFRLLGSLSTASASSPGGHEKRSVSDELQPTGGRN